MNMDNPSKALTDALTSISDAYSTEPEPGSSQDRLRRHVHSLSEFAEQMPAVYRTPLQYHQARILALSGEGGKAAQLLDTLLKQREALPEAVWLKIQLSASGDSEAEGRLRWKYEERLGKALPLSAWGRLRDLGLERREVELLDAAFVDVPRPAIPTLDERDLLRIGELYQEMSFTADAARAWREAIYSGFSPPEFPQCGSETWISVEAAESWMKIARCEAATGKRKWAVQALLMAVAGSPKQQPAANTLLQRMFDEEADELVTPERSPDAQKLTEIARLYRGCNLHPRAVDALDEAAKIPGTDVSKLRSEIESEWKELVAKYASAREQTCFLFGRQVAKTTNPLDLSPASFSY